MGNPSELGPHHPSALSAVAEETVGRSVELIPSIKIVELPVVANVLVCKYSVIFPAASVTAAFILISY